VSATPGVEPNSKKPLSPFASLLTRPLGLEGWTHLEAPLLAALATEAPLLLVGPHGTAKSFLLERLAEALQLEFRFYNASLINYDDLVGIPVPDASQQSLRYISTPSAVWDAEVVFIDELNRTRPDLANKLFPIIHERRVQGIPLTKLRYRWAAMNPPPSDEDADARDQYLGAEPLDPALADRFAFVLQVPDWGDLKEEEQHQVLIDQFRGRHDFPVPVAELVARTRRIYESHQQLDAALKHLSDYVVFLESVRRDSGHRLSPRRCSMLLRNILALHAARVVLGQTGEAETGEDKSAWKKSVWQAVRYSQPSLAETGRLDIASLHAAHEQAWEYAALDLHDPTKSVMRITDPVERFVKAHGLKEQVGVQTLSDLLHEAFCSVTVPAHRTAFAVAAYLAIHEDRDMPATAIETLATEVRRVLQPVERQFYAPMGQVSLSREVGQICQGLLKEATGCDAYRSDPYLRNLLQSLLPDGYHGTTPLQVKEYFEEIWKALGLGDRVPTRNAAQEIDR
jgi:MoxR-like ATPase